jgi:hypothetical protein
MGALSRRVRGVVFVFDLLLNFKFVFAHLDTCVIIFSDSVLLSDFVLDLFVDAFPGLSLGPSSDLLLDPPFKSDPFLVDNPTQDSHFWASSNFGLLLTSPRPLLVLTDTYCKTTVPLRIQTKHIVFPQCR